MPKSRSNGTKPHAARSGRHAAEAAGQRRGANLRKAASPAPGSTKSRPAPASTSSWSIIISATRTRSTLRCWNGFTRRSATQERKLNLEGLPPQQAIKKLIESSFDHLATHPDFIVLLNDENRGGARHVRGSTKTRGHAFTSGQHGLENSQRGRAGRHLSQGHQPGASLHLHRRPQLFLLFNTPTLSAIFSATTWPARPPNAPAASTWSTSVLLQALRP